MYTVVICPECSKVYLVKNNPETVSCRRCSKRKKFDDLKKFYKGDSRLRAIRCRTIVKDEYSDRDRPTEKAVSIIEEKLNETTPREMGEEIVKEKGKVDYETFIEIMLDETDCSNREVENIIEEMRNSDDFILTPEDKLKYVSLF